MRGVVHVWLGWLLAAGVSALAPSLGAAQGVVIDSSAAAQVELGRRLFYDADLSINGTMACATCHEQRHAFSDGNATHPGALDDPGKRNVPGLANVGRLHNLTWANDRLPGLEAQALNPILGDDPIEMGMKRKQGEIARRLYLNACDVKLFAVAFPDSGGTIDMASITAALAAFERTMISFETPYDWSVRWRSALASEAAAKGETMFERAGCVACHPPPLFTDDAFHHVETSRHKTADAGLMLVTGRTEDQGVFRTPSLRNIALTAPYWHDGHARTLADAIREHDLPCTTAGPLSDADIAQIAAFLETLTDRGFVTDKRFAYPDDACPVQ